METPNNLSDAIGMRFIFTGWASAMKCMVVALDGQVPIIRLTDTSLPTIRAEWHELKEAETMI